MIQHLMATAALLDACAVGSRPSALCRGRAGLERALALRQSGGAWGYGPKNGAGDMFHTTWGAYAASLGTMLRLVPFDRWLDGVLNMYFRVTDPEFGASGYSKVIATVSRPKELVRRYPPENSQAMTAAGIWIDQMTGADVRESRLGRLALERIFECKPAWDGQGKKVDLVYWHFAAMALSLCRDERSGWFTEKKACKQWLDHVHALLIENQDELGGWKPLGPWGGPGGEVYATATAALTLLAPAQFSDDWHLWRHRWNRKKRPDIYGEAWKELEKASKSKDPRRAFAAYVAMR